MPEDILRKIVEQKREEIASAKRSLPERVLRDKCSEPRKRRMFLKNLEKPGISGINVIAEIKRASPSKGVICADLNPATLARNYEMGGAAALSVLTDKPFFNGSFEDFKFAREATSLPVLRKDFLISTYQIFESAVMRSDAVLLIVRILEQEQLKDYLGLCDELQMDALVEIHSEDDLQKATRAGARLIGINNRNLQSFETDTDTAVRLKALLAPHQVPVAASGIRTREDIQKTKASGIWNFLIGESLVRSQNPKDFLRVLQGT